MPQEGAPASSFSVDGQIEMGFFADGEDTYHTRINGERVETLIARMLGFPSDGEFRAAMESGVSPDSGQPDVTRVMGNIGLNFHRFDEL